MLVASSVLQVARDNATFLNWSDVFSALAAVTLPQCLVVAVLALLFPRRLGVAAGLAATIWVLANLNELEPVFLAVGVAEAHLGFVVIIVMPMLILAFLMVPSALISRLVGVIGSAFFVTSSIQLLVALNSVSAISVNQNVRHLIDREPIANETPDPPEGVRLPDIIYIVPDRYPSVGVLQRIYDHDNTHFLDTLRSRGFAVAEDARANYLKTHYSLASSMNMQYLNQVLAALDGKTLHKNPLFQLGRNNLVIERLNRLGYRTIVVPNWWDGTRGKMQADEVVRFWPMFFAGEFGIAALKRNPLVMVALYHITDGSQCESLKRQLDFLEEIGGDEQPTFVFVHVLVPHVPILADAQGKCIHAIQYPSENITWERFTEAFSGFVTFFNKRILEIFDKQKRDNPNPLFFVLQSDEGPYPEALHESIARLAGKRGADRLADFDWRQATNDELQTKFGILNAFYLNGLNMNGFPQDFSPINNWRLIFSHLEGVDHPFLPNRYFIYPNERMPYRTIEITEKLDAIPR